MSQTLATVRRRRRDLVLAGVVVCGERAREHGRVDDLEVGEGYVLNDYIMIRRPAHG